MFKRSEGAVGQTGARATDAAALEAAAKAADRAVRECERPIRDGERALEVAESRLCAAIGDGASGAPLAALSAERDDLARRIASYRKDAEAARAVALVAGGRAASARLSALSRAASARLAAAAGSIETALRAVPKLWAAWETAFAEGRALEAELEQHRRRYAESLPAPSAGESQLTPDLLQLARSVEGTLATLDRQRRERAHPAPRPVAEPAPFLVGGDAPRARAQRVALAANVPAPRRGTGPQ